MEPYLHEDDHVLTFNWVKVKAGDVIVFRVGDEHYVKRVEKVSDQKILVEGDNRKVSSKIGPIKASQIVGKVILKY